MNQPFDDRLKLLRVAAVLVAHYIYYERTAHDSLRIALEVSLENDSPVMRAVAPLRVGVVWSLPVEYSRFSAMGGEVGGEFRLSFEMLIYSLLYHLSHLSYDVRFGVNPVDPVLRVLDDAFLEGTRLHAAGAVLEDVAQVVLTIIDAEVALDA